jgi:hypothetical protein
VETDAVVGKRISNSWLAISFDQTFSTTPVVATQVQSNYDSGWVGTRQRNASASAVQIAMEAEEDAATAHGQEVVGWMAIEPGQGTWSGLLFEAGHTPDSVNHKWYTINFGQAFTSAPMFIASLAKYDGGDSSHLRYQNLVNGSVQVKVEEDTTYDRELNHTKEVVDYLVFAADGLLTIPGEVIQPTPIPSPTPRTPQPTHTPTPTDTPEPTPVPTDTPTPTDTEEPTPLPTSTLPPTIVVLTPTPTITATATPTIVVPTYTPYPTGTPSPIPSASCDLIVVDYHYVSSTSYVYLRLRNLNSVPAYLTKSYIDWPMHDIYYLDWLYFGGYYNQWDDSESPNETVLDPPRVLVAGSYGYWYAGFAVRPDVWAAGHWTIDLTFNDECVVPYEFDYLVPTDVPMVVLTPTWTPTAIP